jgi:uncharacterized protein (DUF2342 family)
MGRNSKLSDKQWGEIERRLLDGDKPAALAREYGIDRAAITRRFAQQTKTVKAVANQLLAAEGALRSLPVAQQINAINLADQLRSISGHLAGAANFGAATAHRLAGIANGRVAQIDDAVPLDEKGVTELKGIAVLTRMANEASEIGVNLLRANKEAIEAMNKGDVPEDMNWTVSLVPANER